MSSADLSREMDPAPERTELTMSMVLVVFVVFVAMSGFDTDNALQVFDSTLGSAIDTIEAGSLVRRMAMVLLAVWALVSLAGRGARRARPSLVVAVPLMAFFSLALASPLWAIDRDLTIRRVVLLAMLALGAYAFARRAGALGLTKLTFVISAGFVALALIAQVTFGSFRPLDGGWRLAGIMHPVALSWYCGLGAIAAIALIKQIPNRRNALIAATVFFIGALVLTRTRTGIAGALVGIVALYFLSTPRRLQQRIAGASVVLGLVLFGVILASAAGLTWSSTYGSLIDITSLGREDAVDQFDTFSGRLPIWLASLQLVAERPFLGYGYNAFSSPEMLEEFAQTAGWVPTSPHSGYLEVLLDLGVIGLVVFGTLIFGGIRASLRLAKHRPEYSFTAAALLWLVVNLFFEAPVFFDPAFVSFAIFGLLIDVWLSSMLRRLPEMAVV